MVQEVKHVRHVLAEKLYVHACSKSAMTRQAESTELTSINDEKDRDSSQSRTTNREIWRKIAAVRWREIVIASIIVMDLFLLNASISLIGVFFPNKVSKFRKKLIHMVYNF